MVLAEVEMVPAQVLAFSIFAGVLATVAGFVLGLVVGISGTHAEAVRRGFGRWHPRQRYWQWAVPGKILDTDGPNFEDRCEGKPVYYRAGVAE